MNVESNAPLQPHNTFGIVARARTLVRVRSAADVHAVLAHPELAQEPKFVLGGGSNIVLTGDVKAVVLKVEVAGKRVLEDGVRHCEALGCIVEEAEPDFSGADHAFEVFRALAFATTYGGVRAEHGERLKETVRWNIDLNPEHSLYVQGSAQHFDRQQVWRACDAAIAFSPELTRLWQLDPNFAEKVARNLFTGNLPSTTNPELGSVYARHT